MFVSFYFNTLQFHQIWTKLLNNLYCKILAFLYQKSYKNKSKFSNMHNVTHTYIRCTCEYLKSIFLINFCHQKRNFYLNFSNKLNACWSCVSIQCKRYDTFSLFLWHHISCPICGGLTKKKQYKGKKKREQKELL